VLNADAEKGSKKSTVVLLRWVLIIAFSYLMLLDASKSQLQARLALLIAAALSSNLLVIRIPERWAESRVFDFSVVLFDAAWVTLGLSWAPTVSDNLFLLYFLVIFVAAMGESLLMTVGSAVLVSVVYAAPLPLERGADLQVMMAALLRVPFLFAVALFYGYFVTQLRSRRNEAGEARLREQAKSELLAAVSHDLRGPLSNAEVLLALVLHEQNDDVAAERDLLLRVQTNVRRVGSLVANLLQASCIEAGQVCFQCAPLQINDVVDDVFNLESGAAILKHITLSRETDPETPQITADHIQVGRILTNLVNNAIKYTKSGEVMIRTEHDERSVRVIVRDSGPGMNAEQCEALFAPYRRVHLHDYTPGTGLGLYIAKRLTEAQGGSISVSSQVGIGSSFVVSFPRRPPNGAPGTVRVPAGAAAAARCERSGISGRVQVQVA
jgi:signal transduction histidine kinase